MAFSIIIPAYNAEQFISDQIESLLKIGFCNGDELIVVNNNSSDATPQIVDCFAQQYEFIKRVDALERQGVNYARNIGIIHAKNENILIVDADDIANSFNLKELLFLLEEYDFVGGGYQKLLWDGATYKPEQIVTTFPTTLGEIPYTIGAVMGMKKSLHQSLRGFDESYVGGHDEVDFAIRASQIGVKMGWLDKPVILYRQRAGIKKTAKQLFHYGRTNMQLTLNFFDQFEHSNIYFKILLRKFLFSIQETIQQRKFDAESIGGISWSAGRLYGYILYKTFGKIPARKLMTTAEIRNEN